ncbi:hypothetical protein [Candidatus Magnetaquicoccus inordinatus]|uniref:hypothetical protein n=1 Tax=Candidatus Magnetaquicoccus inordinatus TaxID=2496818 RepID=UPI00102CF75F|nr:hypothetical protein [Candidatus Magnetaquicoccus inordinatus]
MNRARVHYLSAALLILSGCATLSADRGAEFDAEEGSYRPDWKVGEAWHYDDGYAVAVAAQEGDKTTFVRLDQKGECYKRQGFLLTDSYVEDVLRTNKSITPQASGKVDGRLRLTPGYLLNFTREFTANGVARKHRSLFKVEGEEEILVPAGRFKTYVIVWNTINPVSGWEGFEKWWYSVDLKHYIRMEYRYGLTAAGSRVLVKHTPVAEGGVSPSALHNGCPLLEASRK